MREGANPGRGSVVTAEAGSGVRAGVNTIGRCLVDLKGVIQLSGKNLPFAAGHRSHSTSQPPPAPHQDLNLSTKPHSSEGGVATTQRVCHGRMMKWP